MLVGHFFGPHCLPPWTGWRVAGVAWQNITFLEPVACCWTAGVACCRSEGWTEVWPPCCWPPRSEARPVVVSHLVKANHSPCLIGSWYLFTTTLTFNVYLLQTLRWSPPSRLLSFFVSTKTCLPSTLYRTNWRRRRNARIIFIIYSVKTLTSQDQALQRDLDSRPIRWTL